MMESARRPNAHPMARPVLPATLDTATLPRDELADEVLLRALRFDGLDLGARTAMLIDLEGCELVATSLAGGNLDKLTAIDCVFRQCDLANLTVSHSSLARVQLTGCRATGLALSGAVLRQVTLRDCLADMSAFRFATLTKVHLIDCRLQRADFVSADLTSTVFRRCDLTGAELSQVKARGAVFVDCTWDGVRGLPSLSGATVVHSSPLDAHAFMVGMAGNLGIRLGHPGDFPESD